MEVKLIDRLLFQNIHNNNKHQRNSGGGAAGSTGSGPLLSYGTPTPLICTPSGDVFFPDSKGKTYQMYILNASITHYSLDIYP